VSKPYPKEFRDDVVRVARNRGPASRGVTPAARSGPTIRVQTKSRDTCELCRETQNPAPQVYRSLVPLGFTHLASLVAMIATATARVGSLLV